MMNTDYLQMVDTIADNLFLWNGATQNLFPFHQHQKAQFSYVEGGVTFLNTPHCTYLVPARHFAWVPPGTAHFFRHKYPSHTICTFYVPYNSWRKDPFYLKTGIYPVNSLLLEMIVYIKRWEGNLATGSVGEHFLRALIDTLPGVGANALPIALPTTDNERLQPVIHYMQQHLDERLSLESISRLFAFSERTLSRLFRSEMDISFFQYLKHARVIKAMEYLLETDNSVSEIAYETGYTSISAFSNTFYQLAGSRPTDFRALKNQPF
jgi:AraC-like DNA-binding protein